SEAAPMATRMRRRLGDTGKNRLGGRLAGCLGALLPLILSAAPAAAADAVDDGDPPRIEEAERGFHFTTERLQVTVQDGLIVSLVNRLTGESHTTSAAPDRAMPFGMGHLQGGLDSMKSTHVPWRMSAFQLTDEAKEIPATR